MRVAALYDIHGNLPALEAVLEQVAVERIDRLVVGGDVVPGPMPRECLKRLSGSSVPVQFIIGNGEVAVLAEHAGMDPGVPAQARDAVRWSARQLSDADAEFLATWPKTLEIEGLAGILFCHATPRDENESFTRLTPAERLLPAFANVNAAVVICGHTHMQFDRVVGSIRVVNAGSVGMPFGEPSADWLLLGPEVELRHTNYDLAGAAERIRATNYPQAEDFAARNILRPPSEEEMLRLYTKMEQR